MSENNLPNEGMENEIENEETTSFDEAENIESAENEKITADEDLPVSEIENNEVITDNSQLSALKAASKFKTSAIIAWILVVILAAVDIYYYMTNIYNKYNHIGYLNVNGYTIGEVVAGMGMEFDEFKEMYGLPQDMKKDTYMNAAQAMIPVSKMAELNGVDFDTLKERYNIGDDITEESTWGEAIDSMLLKDYVGEDQFDEFKTTYSLGDEVTLETKWGDIRKDVEKKQVAERLAAEAASASPSASADADVESDTDADTDSTTEPESSDVAESPEPDDAE